MVGVLDGRSQMMPPAIPIATYRLQLTADFGLAQAAERASYLKALSASPGGHCRHDRL
jgi:hypothetical protein